MLLGGPQISLCVKKLPSMYKYSYSCAIGKSTISGEPQTSKISGKSTTDRLTIRPTEHTPLDGGPTYPILCAVEATILGHILAPFWVHLGMV